MEATVNIDQLLNKNLNDTYPNAYPLTESTMEFIKLQNKCYNKDTQK